jgi:hypothetical protein
MTNGRDRLAGLEIRSDNDVNDACEKIEFALDNAGICNGRILGNALMQLVALVEDFYPEFSDELSAIRTDLINR